MTDEPLHVQVARKIGWRQLYQAGNVWVGLPPDGDETTEVPPFEQLQVLKRDSISTSEPARDDCATECPRSP